jgi:hypothetical protein
MIFGLVAVILISLIVFTLLAETSESIISNPAIIGAYCTYLIKEFWKIMNKL